VPRNRVFGNCRTQRVTAIEVKSKKNKRTGKNSPNQREKRKLEKKKREIGGTCAKKTWGATKKEKWEKKDRVENVQKQKMPFFELVVAETKSDR